MVGYQEDGFVFIDSNGIEQNLMKVFANQPFYITVKKPKDKGVIFWIDHCSTLRFFQIVGLPPLLG